jgi:hypothetical protein
MIALVLAVPLALAFLTLDIGAVAGFVTGQNPPVMVVALVVCLGATLGTALVIRWAIRGLRAR